MVLLSETRGRIRLLTLNRPEKRNALSTELVRILLDALHAADAEEAVAGVVITGAGPGFCAGADLAERAALIQDEAKRAERATLSDTLMAAPGLMGKPVVAALNGAGVGAGASIALCCDMAVAAEEARFAWPEAKHAIYPSLVAPMLLRHLSPRDVFELLATGATLSAAEAHALRLVNRVVPRARLLDEACVMAEAAALYPPDMLRRIKQEINAGGLPR